MENPTGLLVGSKKKSPNRSQTVIFLFYAAMKYHNESHFEMTDNSKHLDEEEKKREEERRRKEEQINSKLPTYDPKNANKTSIVFGDDTTDYKKKDESSSNPPIKVRNPPGGRSNIQFG